MGSRDTDPAVSDPTVDVESKSQPPQKSVRLAGLDMLPETDRGKDMDATTSPAERLEGLTLKSGWFIEKLLVKPKGATGGDFGVSYSASKDGNPAFVKAIDFRRAFGETNFIEVLNALTSAVLWERDLMKFCKDEAMSRVVTLLDYEDLVLTEDQGDHSKKVCCFVFEIGKGDLRANFDFGQSPKHSWRLMVLRDVALGLDQLHRRGIAHLDVKPSNVIALADSLSRAHVMKLGDLGRSVRKGFNGPFDGLCWPGDRGYAPPEKWYGYTSSQWQDEREAADLYQLGGLLVFLYTGVPLNSLIRAELPEQFTPGIYRGGFTPELVDVLKQSIGKVLALHVFPSLPPQVSEELRAMLVDMTQPDPSQRGDRAARKQGVVGIDRFHQKLYRLAKRMEIEERRVAA